MTESAECSAEEEIRVALQRGRKWSSWQLIWTSGGPGAVDCSAVEQAMRGELQAFFSDLSVHTTLVGGAGDRIAIRISISDRLIARSAHRKTTTIYLLYFLRSDLVLASSCKVWRTEYRNHVHFGQKHVRAVQVVCPSMKGPLLFVFWSLRPPSFSGRICDISEARALWRAGLQQCRRSRPQRTADRRTQGACACSGMLVRPA